MTIFWATFRKNIWQFYRGIILLLFGFWGIGSYLWHYNDCFSPRGRSACELGKISLYGGLFMLGMAVVVIAIRYGTIRRSQRPKG